MQTQTAPAPQAEIKIPTRDEIAQDIQTLAAMREKYRATGKPHAFTAAGALHTSLSALGHLIVALEAKPATPDPEPPVRIPVDTSKELAQAEAEVAKILNPPGEPAAAPEGEAPEDKKSGSKKKA